jgi:TonB family protein
MNRLILSTLVLPSVLGLAQAGMAVEPKPMNPSVVLLAEAKQPAGLAEVALAGGHNFVNAAAAHSSAAEYAFKGNAPITSQAPRVTKAVEVELTPSELANAPAVTAVVLRAIVDERGVPRNVTVTRSGGSVVDQKAIAALNQYRFAPATLDNQPTWSTVSVTIKIQK